MRANHRRVLLSSSMRWWESGEIILGRLGKVSGALIKIFTVLGVAIWAVQQIPQTPRQVVAPITDVLTFDEPLMPLRIQATASMNHLAAIRHAATIR